MGEIASKDMRRRKLRSYDESGRTGDGEDDHVGLRRCRT